ncbi:hypothetical protein DERP_015369 [Dermatophagoides pteronyssinus]|uniref:Uncharacterized protein n=1 Tax=Dermatophagoides pteronyssinus TaxID=6956 RepID=A0ABQ8J5U9_DERPT|nr:hypothetical protein DERP_015369 [Dermatophagoides pteronyssinus]
MLIIYNVIKYNSVPLVWFLVNTVLRASSGWSQVRNPGQSVHAIKKNFGTSLEISIKNQAFETGFKPIVKNQ